MGKESPSSFTARFGSNLRRVRKRIGISQEELSVRASLHRTAVGELERGSRVARVDTLVKLAGALGVPAEELLDGLKWSPGEPTTGKFV
jgi:XRE family transcriptional regulator, regulator of sulfur utilization